MDVLQSVSKVSRALMINEPFYGVFMSTLNKKVDPRVPTAGVAKQGINTELVVNPTFWEGLTDNVKYGVLKHELLHICFFHLTLRDKYSDKLLFNIAADIAINQLIDPKYKTSEFLHIQSFPEITLDPLKDTDYYYQKLLKDKDKSETLKNMLADPEFAKEHATWDQFSNLSEAEKQLIDKQVEYQMKATYEAIKNKGSVPGELKGFLDRLLNPTPAKFNWRSYLRRFAGGSNKIYTIKTRKKDSRRYPGNPALKIKSKRHILVAIDTSGSVSDGELMEFMNEIHHIYKTDTKVTIIQCDAKIRGIEEYKGNPQIEIKGRGGTEFDPVIQYYNDNYDKYCSLIYLTDGECSCYVQPRGKMLWVHSTVSPINESLPGYKIQLN